MAIDATIAGAASETYATVAEADAYATLRGLTFSGTEAEKEQALRRAVSWLDARYRGEWPGDKREGRAQALEWPRSNAYDADGELLDSAAIPVEVKNAQIEAAIREIASAGALSPDVTGEKVLTGLGDLSWTLTGTGADAKRPTLTVVDDMLSGIIGNTGATRMVFRA